MQRKGLRRDSIVNTIAMWAGEVMNYPELVVLLGDSSYARASQVRERRSRKGPAVSPRKQEAASCSEMKEECKEAKSRLLEMTDTLREAVKPISKPWRKPIITYSTNSGFGWSRNSSRRRNAFKGVCTLEEELCKHWLLMDKTLSGFHTDKGGWERESCKGLCSLVGEELYEHWIFTRLAQLCRSLRVGWAFDSRVVFATAVAGVGKAAVLVAAFAEIEVAADKFAGAVAGQQPWWCALIRLFGTKRTISGCWMHNVARRASNWNEIDCKRRKKASCFTTQLKIKTMQMA